MIHIKEAQVLYKKWQEMRAENPALVCDHPALLRSFADGIGKTGDRICATCGTVFKIEEK
ncbi:MAG TPA: hypothetical protein H9889_10130 [Candidatus Ignatzschineria merdigallinarum]|uniref:Uncharacterized protein n=1 Tax=Candidatus Ignatzschineria merdigallinarum TaxID=2838621 RepID=A0A9D1Q7V9_9GAMM|nr:hypothetical protein [Candidatus Ignatzschineria merdigallinarum]